MYNILKINENQRIDDVDKSDEIIEQSENIKIIKFKLFQSFNESNLMVIPFVSLQRQKVKTIERSWETNGIKRGIKVVGSAESGCPTILEMDVLLGLFRILVKNVDFKYEYNKNTNTVNLPRKINFTYQELAKELGYSIYGGSIKKKLEKSIKTLLETTIYSNFALRDVNEGEYITDFNGEESFRILKNYKSYSYSKKKKKCEKIGNSKEIKEQQSVDIDDFFFKNICNNYFNIYDYTKYVKLTKGISKKMFLLLSQWSHGYIKYLNYSTIYDYIGVDITLKQTQYYYNRIIKDSLDELKDIKFIDDYEVIISEGINFIFNINKLRISKGYDKYKSTEETIGRLQELGITFEEWTKYYRIDNEDYVKALLRYIDDKIKKGEVRDERQYTLTGLKYENYDVTKYMH
ncbi:replication initiator protein A [Clostridium tagluense]|uniref:Uncharacterized protein n=1 Tax=Clostridium tagluense TaxID=360422 RepID=A0A401UTP4_9CLOT|nr:replication initiator protein A [Clostridium tagluense]GCD12876.1 hypothetical protein Ctaglu_44990 [Clostridium tagluense]